MLLGFVALMIVSLLMLMFGFLYIRASFHLLERMKRHAPALWAALGRPERVYVSNAGSGMHTIKPMGPWLGWVLSPSSRGPVPKALRKGLSAVRFHGAMAILCLLAFLALFIGLPTD
ncbi:MAG: hypothetical protein ACPG4N_08255 [Gammaproteobacteria bacterium]